MRLSSPKIAFDDRLLAIEEQLRQRKFSLAMRELVALDEKEFSANPQEAGLYGLLASEGAYYDGEYAKSINYGLNAGKLLAETPLHRRYGRIQLVLSKNYSAIGDLRSAAIRARDASSAYRRASDTIGLVDSLNELGRIAFIRSDFKEAAAHLEEAVGMVRSDPRKLAQLTGNLGRIRIHTGEWAAAEKELTETLRYDAEHGEEVSQAINLLSLGYLHLKHRHFSLARRSLDEALVIVSRLGLKREKIVYLEYAGELAFEKGDTLKAKSLLSDAFQRSLLLAPGSGLACQSARRLAEVELALDNLDEAMKYAQKGLELALSVGERLEVGHSRRMIAQVFAARSDSDEAIEYIRSAVETLREVGNPLDIARTLLVMAQIKISAGSTEYEKIRATLEESHRTFKKLKLSHWVAETDFAAGGFACQRGDLTAGFKKLSRAEKIFSSGGAVVKVKQVNAFLRSLSEQAVALAISGENEFKVFGNMVTPAELSDIRTSQLDEILQILLRKTNGSKAIVYFPASEEGRVVTASPDELTDPAGFADCFERLLGQEICRSKPTMLMDCRRDPFIKELFPSQPDIVAALMVIPFKMADNSTSYVYIDRITENNTLRPFNQSELNFAVAYSDLIAFKWTEIQKNSLVVDNRRLRSQLMEQSAFPNFITCNREILAVLDQVRQVVDSTISMVVEGETGTGKDLLAKAIHYNSCRRDKRFISVNCAALPETLLESELFGYQRGAFTGADRDKPGLFEEADGGTFFLDEVGDMPLSVQAKVLRVLEQKEIVRLGETVPRKIDVRILSATNRDLKKMMESGRFRPDLYYRLSAMTMHLSALRDRREDIPLLISHFLEGTGKTFAAEAMEVLLRFDWPGNVRELENEITKAVLLAGSRTEISVDLLSSKINASGSSRRSQPSSGFNGHDVEFDENYSLYDYLGEHEKRFIIRALKEKRGVKKHAAVELNIPESTLRLKIKQYGIDLTNLDSYHY